MVSDETIWRDDEPVVNAADGKGRLRLSEFLPYRLSIASNLVAETIARAYARLFGLSIPQWRLVAVLAETGGATQRELVQRTRMDKVTVSRAAAVLVERRLVRRLDNRADRRSRVLILSTTGKALYADVSPQALRLEKLLFRGFEPDELARFTEALSRIEASASALLEADAEETEA